LDPIYKAVDARKVGLGQQKLKEGQGFRPFDPSPVDLVQQKLKEERKLNSDLQSLELRINEEHRDDVPGWCIAMQVSKNTVGEYKHIVPT
jgi:hypothetical protein